jgi:CBS domain containing-hemolysin-like protein
VTSSLCRSIANLVLLATLMILLGARGGSLRTAGLAMAIAGGIVAVFGVAIPHAWAASAGESILSATFGVLLAFRYLLAPLVALMCAFDLPIRRLTGAEVDDDRNGSAKQEIIQAATEGAAEGSVDAEEVEMIESVMEFGETHAGEIMTPRTDMFALPVETPLAEAIGLIVDAGHSRIPVYESDLDNITGILYAKDLLRGAEEQNGSSLADYQRKPYFVPETKRLDDLLREFKARKVHLAVILDEYGGTAGLITIEDLLEEIVGDISDEYDTSRPSQMTRIDQQTVEVDGRLHIDELNDALALEIPEDEDYDTVAGFVFSELGYIPAAKERLETHGAAFTILSASDRKIDRLRVELLPKPAEEQAEA